MRRSDVVMKELDVLTGKESHEHIKINYVNH
jgi:hypothetical protein